MVTDGFPVSEVDWDELVRSSDVSEIEIHLVSADASIRLQAVQALREIGNECAVAALRPGLFDEDAAVRDAATVAWLALGSMPTMTAPEAKAPIAAAGDGAAPSAAPVEAIGLTPVSTTAAPPAPGLSQLSDAELLDLWEHPDEDTDRQKLCSARQELWKRSLPFTHPHPTRLLPADRLIINSTPFRSLLVIALAIVAFVLLVPYMQILALTPLEWKRTDMAGMNRYASTVNRFFDYGGLLADLAFAVNAFLVVAVVAIFAKIRRLLSVQVGWVGSVIVMFGFLALLLGPIISGWIYAAVYNESSFFLYVWKIFLLWIWDDLDTYSRMQDFVSIPSLLLSIFASILIFLIVAGKIIAPVVGWSFRNLVANIHVPVSPYCPICRQTYSFAVADLDGNLAERDIESAIVSGRTAIINESALSSVKPPFWAVSSFWCDGPACGDRAAYVELVRGLTPTSQQSPSWVSIVGIGEVTMPVARAFGAAIRRHNEQGQPQPTMGDPDARR